MKRIPKPPHTFRSGTSLPVSGGESFKYWLSLVGDHEGSAGFHEPLRPPDLPHFSDIELIQMHNYCIKYRDLVRSGAAPTEEQSTRFMKYQRVCFGEGVAYGRQCN
ncbi:MAG: hypothetical protein DRR42_23205 [Gammaproteobacteria bacterium]|nr:MAG: hypothetical protein DRR42_23205 [Gammaproteobacteria bacterium]